MKIFRLLPLPLLLLLALPVRAEITIEEVTSPGGIKAWLVEDHGIPFTALEIRFEGGTSLDAPGKRGAVNLMSALLEEGTGDLDAQGFAAARDGLAADLKFSADADSVGVSARFLTENRDQVMDLLQGAILAPRFDADAVERVRGQILSNLRNNAQDPQSLASDRFSALAFGDHPYASDGDGTEASVTALTRDDIVAAHAATVARDRLFVSAVGDITGEDLGMLLDKLLGGLPASGASLPGRAEWQMGGGVTVIDFPTPQSVIVFGHEGIPRADDDFYAAYVLNEILGSSRFSARLMTEVREKRGLTYGISTYLLPMDHGEMLMGQMATANATVGDSIDLIREQWVKLATEGVTPEELAATKTYLTGSYPLRFDGNGPIARILVGMQMEELPIDYAATRNAKIEAVTLEDIKRVAARVLQPDNLHFVVVGQPEGVVSTN